MARPLAGEIVVFTGFRDGALARKVSSLGGIYKDSLSKAVTTVVVKDETMLHTNKARAARERGLRVLTRDEFEESPAASASSVVRFDDPAFREAAGLPPPALTDEVTRRAGVRCVASETPAVATTVGAAAAAARWGAGAAPGAGSSSADASLGASRVGGQPDLPSGVAWPRAGGRPMLFLAQIDCTRASLVDGCALLPRHGWLLFFVADDYVGEPGGARIAGSYGAGFSGAGPGGGEYSDDDDHDDGDDAGDGLSGTPPSKVIFVAAGSKLTRAAWPRDLPDAPGYRLPLTWLRFEAGDSEAKDDAVVSPAGPAAAAPVEAATTAAAGAVGAESATSAPAAVASAVGVGSKRRRGAAASAAVTTEAEAAAEPRGAAAQARAAPGQVPPVPTQMLGPPAKRRRAGDLSGTDTAFASAAVTWQDVYEADQPGRSIATADHPEKSRARKNNSEAEWTLLFQLETSVGGTIPAAEEVAASAASPFPPKADFAPQRRKYMFVMQEEHMRQKLFSQHVVVVDPC